MESFSKAASLFAGSFKIAHIPCFGLPYVGSCAHEVGYPKQAVW